MMTKKRPTLRRPKTFIAFGDQHIPYHNASAMEVVAKVIEYIRPDLAVNLGDMLDCSQFSFHPPTRGMAETDYAADLEYANIWLDRVEDSCGRLVMIEGNHEYRLDRWAAATTEGRGAYSMLAPRLQLARGRKRFSYIPYGSADGRYPHYAVNSRIVAVHGWSYALNSVRKHLEVGQGRSVVFGHTHRSESKEAQNIWETGRIVQARSAGCLCQLIPLYGTGRPVEWVNAFVLGYLGRRSDSLYTVPIMGDRCILPDAKEITA